MRNVLFLMMILAGLSCSDTSANAQTKLSADAFEAMLAKDKTVQLVDVRTPREYAGGHLEGAQLINYYDADFGQKITRLDKEKPVLVYCAVGGRSAGAAEKLQQMGFKAVYDLEGGISAWRAGGKKTVQ